MTLMGLWLCANDIEPDLRVRSHHTVSSPPAAPSAGNQCRSIKTQYTNTQIHKYTDTQIRKYTVYSEPATCCAHQCGQPPPVQCVPTWLLQAVAYRCVIMSRSHTLCVTCAAHRTLCADHTHVVVCGLDSSSVAPPLVPHQAKPFHWRTQTIP